MQWSNCMCTNIKIIHLFKAYPHNLAEGNIHSQPHSMSATTCILSCPHTTGPWFTWKLGTPQSPAVIALQVKNDMQCTMYNVHMYTGRCILQVYLCVEACNCCLISSVLAAANKLSAAKPSSFNNPLRTLNWKKLNKHIYASSWVAKYLLTIAVHENGF